MFSERLFLSNTASVKLCVCVWVWYHTVNDFPLQSACFEQAEFGVGGVMKRSGGFIFTF